jgi:hypothetical protein
MAEEGCLTRTIELAKDDDLELRILGMGALRHMSINTRVKRPIVVEGGIVPVFLSVEAAEQDIDLLRQCSALLSNVAENGENQVGVVCVCVVGVCVVSSTPLPILPIYTQYTPIYYQYTTNIPIYAINNYHILIYALTNICSYALSNQITLVMDGVLPRLVHLGMYYVYIFFTVRVLLLLLLYMFYYYIIISYKTLYCYYIILYTKLYTTLLTFVIYNTYTTHSLTLSMSYVISYHRCRGPPRGTARRIQVLRESNRYVCMFVCMYVCTL